MPWRPDGHVRYRTIAHGQRVGIIPRHCKLRRHDLSVTGYTAKVRRGSDQHPAERDDLLVVACTACNRDRNPDYAWTLVLSGPAPARAEMDDGPYADITPHYVQAPI